MADKIKITITTNDDIYGENKKEFSKEYELTELSHLAQDAQPIVSQENYDIKNYNGSTLYAEIEIEDITHEIYGFYFTIRDIVGQSDMKEICAHTQQILLDCVKGDNFDFKFLCRFKRTHKEINNDFNMKQWNYYKETNHQLYKIDYATAVNEINYQKELAIQKNMYQHDSAMYNAESALDDFDDWMKRNPKYLKAFLRGPHPRPYGKKVMVTFNLEENTFTLDNKSMTKEEVMDLIRAKKNVFINKKAVRMSKEDNDIVLNIETTDGHEWTIIQEAQAQKHSDEFSNQLDQVGSWEFDDTEAVREVTEKDGKYIYRDNEVSKKQIINSLLHTQKNVTINGKKIKLTADEKDFEFIDK